jgi:uracil-DNA glycosylase family 4
MYITAAVRCAPPMNKPTPEEIANCRPYLLRELELLTQLRVIIGLGKIGFDAAFDALRQTGFTDIKPRPRFGHGAEVKLSTRLTLLGTYHPSQQNTFTGKLTEEMMDAVFMRARELVDAGNE